MEKKKFKIEELKIQSFVTDSNTLQIKGGSSGDVPQCFCGTDICDTGAYCAGGGDGGGTDDPNCTMNVGCTTVTPGSQTCTDQSTPYCTGGPTVAACGGGGGGGGSYGAGPCEEPY